MKVTSPVGDFPYEIERVALEQGHLVLLGRMGSWPGRVELELRDAARLASVLRLPLLTAGVAGLVLLARRRAASPR